MNSYTTPEMNVTRFADEDVCTASTSSTKITGGGGGVVLPDDDL